MYKILQLKLPQPLTRIISDYITRKTATIAIDDFTGPTFPLSSGVRQGGCLSPTLFNLYIRDLPNLIPHIEHLMYADDVTQIITLPGSKKYRAKQVVRAIESIISFEHK